MQYVIGDLTKIKNGIVAHQVNLYGVMGAGVALYLSKLNPGLLEDYKAFCEKAVLGDLFLWKNPSNPDLVIANVFSQFGGNIGDELGGQPVKQYGSRNHGITSYDSIIKAFEKLESMISNHAKGISICVPFGYGCGIAGGQWEIVEKIFSDYECIKVVCREMDVLRDLGDTAKVRKWIKSLEVLNG